MLLARAGHRVLLLDRTSLPSDTMSTHYVHQPAVARLRRWGLLDTLKATNCPPLDIARWHLKDVRLTGVSVPADEHATPAYGPRRYVLDTLLKDAAVASGAEFRPGANLTGLVRDGNDRVVGVRFKEGAREFTEHATVVVGADGRESTVARMAGARTYEEVPSLSCLYYTYWSGFPCDYEIYVEGRRGIGALTTNDDLVIIGIQWPREEFETVRRDIEVSYLAALDTAAPGLAERVRAGSREERFVGTGNLPNFFRDPYGPGWALVGDAGYHKDPVGAYGISDAIHHAELLANRLGEALAGTRPLDEALADYGEERDRDSMTRYQFNLEAAKFDPLPELLDILRFVQHDQVQTNRFFGMMSGVLAPEEFFTPDLIDRAVGADELLAVGD